MGLEPVCPVFEDGTDGGEGFDVVNDGGSAEGPCDGGERRFDAWPAAFAFERFEQRGFLAADVGAGTALQVEIGPAVIDLAHARTFAEDLVGVGFLDGGFEDLAVVVVLAADVEVGGVELARAHADSDAFDNEVWIELDEDLILECGGFRLVGVDGEEALPAVLWRQEGPLHAGGKTRSATAAQFSSLDDLDDVLRLHADGLIEGSVTVLLDEGVVSDGLAMRELASWRRGDSGQEDRIF